MTPKKPRPCVVFEGWFFPVIDLISVIFPVQVVEHVKNWYFWKEVYMVSSIFHWFFFITFYFLTTQKWCMEITPKYTITIINTLSMLLKGPGSSMNYVVGLPNNAYKRITILIPWISISWSQNKYNILSAASELDQLFLQYR